MIRNLIFDMGNVLLDYNPQICLNLFLKHPKDREIIMDELFHGPEWIEADKGDITCDEMFVEIKKRVPERLHPALRKCIDHWQICMTPLPGAKEYITAAKKAGYQIYLLSNASSSIYDYFPSFLPFDFFDGAVISSDVHLIKPNPKIYLHLLHTFHLQAAECLFIDDRAENVSAAVRLGMNGFLFKGSFEGLDQTWNLSVST